MGFIIIVEIFIANLSILENFLKGKVILFCIYISFSYKSFLNIKLFIDTSLKSNSKNTMAEILRYLCSHRKDGINTIFICPLAFSTFYHVIFNRELWDDIYFITVVPLF